MDTALWSTFLAATPDAVLTCDSALRCTWANAAGLALLGASDTAAVAGRNLDTLLGAQTAAAITPYMARARATGETVTARHVLPLAHGGPPVTATCVPVGGAEGGVHTLVVQLHNIAEQRDTVDAQADREHLYRQMFTNNPAIKLLIDPDSGHIVDANPAAERFYGLSVAELCRRSIHTINTLDPEAIRAEMDQARREQRTYFNFRHRLADGSERDVEVYTGPVRVGGHTYLHSLVHDVTEEKAYRARLESYRDLFQRLPVGVYRARLDQEGAILEANQAFATILDAESADAMVGTPLRQLYYTDEARTNLLNTLRDEGEARFNALSVRTLAGRDIEISVVARRLPGSTDTYGGMIQDVTERRRLERERDRLAAVVEATPDMVSMADSDGRILYDNPALKHLLGSPPDSPTAGRELGERHPEWANRLVREEGLPAATRDGTWQGETAVLASDGTEIPVSQMVIAHRDAQGAVERYATIMRDLRPERKVEEARRQLIEILETTPDFISMSDPDRNVIYLSAGARRMVGLPPSRPGAMGFDVPPEIARAGEWLHPDWASRIVVNEGIPQAMAHGTWTGETAIYDVTGNEIPVSQVIITHFDNQGQLARISTILRDISAHKTMEAELQRSNTELETFAYSVSHDLQEPLRMVMGFLDLLERRFADTLPAKGRDYVARARDGAGRMQAMINGLLEYSRVTTRGGDFAPVAARDAVDEALANLDLRVRETGADVRVAALPAVQADANQLARLFQNLMGNALKYRHPDRAPVIQVTATVDNDGMAHFAVADNGRGMAPEHQDRAFMLFQRLDTDPDAPAGSGIGLAVCKRIVERHGGRISVDSTPDEGSTFTFSLPAVTTTTGS